MTRQYRPLQEKLEDAVACRNHWKEQHILAVAEGSGVASMVPFQAAQRFDKEALRLTAAIAISQAKRWAK